MGTAQGSLNSWAHAGLGKNGAAGTTLSRGGGQRSEENRVELCEARDSSTFVLHGDLRTPRSPFLGLEKAPRQANSRTLLGVRTPPWTCFDSCGALLGLAGCSRDPLSVFSWQGLLRLICSANSPGLRSQHLRADGFRGDCRKRRMCPVSPRAGSSARQP